MAICPNCQSVLEEGAGFCGKCGTPVPRVPSCPNCGAPITREFAFCKQCGMPLGRNAAAPAVSAAPAGKEKKPSKPIPKKALLFGGIGIVVLAAIIVTVILLAGGGGDRYAFYLKDGEIYGSDLSEDGIVKVTSRLQDGENYSNERLSEKAPAIAAYITVNEDGDRVFYPDRIDNYSFTLYYRDISNSGEDPVKVDSDVTNYMINSDGTKVVYMKDSGEALYISDLKDKEKIASNVRNFTVTEDFEAVGYRTEDYDYYVWYEDKERVKVVSDYSTIEYVSDDLSEVYYTKDGSLYKQVVGEDSKEKIDSDVSEVAWVYDSGELYYTKSEEVQQPLIDFVEDDMADYDATITEPEYPTFPDSPTYPYSWDFDTTEEYNAAKEQYEADYAAYEDTCDELRSAYYAAYDVYEEKLDRDYLRSDLSDMTIEQTVYSLYYYDGETSTVVTNDLANEWGSKYAYNNAIMIIETYSPKTIKVQLSGVSSAYDLRSSVYDALYASTEKMLVVGTEMSAIEQEDALYYNITDDGKTVYFLDNASYGSGDLYKMEITDGKAGTPTLYDSDVSTVGYSLRDGHLIYYKNVDEDCRTGDLYIDGEEVDYDVRLWYIDFLDDAIVYYTDWNFDKEYGTLKLYRDGTKTKVSEDVRAYCDIGDDLLYLYDYSSSNYCGTLCLFHDGETTRIDEDVVALLPARSYNALDGYYFGD